MAKVVAKKNVVNEPRKKGSIFLELENTAANGRRLMYEAMKTVLADKGMVLTEVMFSRYCLEMPVKQFVPKFLNTIGKPGLVPEKLAQEILAAYRAAFNGGGAKLNNGVQKLLKLAAERDVKVGFISCFDADTARKTAAALGLGDLGPALYPCYFEDKGCPGSDAWLMLARNVNARLPHIVAVPTSGVSCKCALAAGMRCVAVPDRFTSFHDFSGVDFVFDEFNKETVDSIFSVLERH